MRSEGYSSWVCVSVKSHLTYGVSVRPENAVTYSAYDEGQKMCGVFSETAPLQISSTPSVVQPYIQSAIFTAHALTNEACQLACVREFGRRQAPNHWQAKAPNHWQASIAMASISSSYGKLP